MGWLRSRGSLSYIKNNEVRIIVERINGKRYKAVVYDFGARKKSRRRRYFKSFKEAERYAKRIVHERGW